MVRDPERLHLTGTCVPLLSSGCDNYLSITYLREKLQKIPPRKLLTNNCLEAGNCLSTLGNLLSFPSPSAIFLLRFSCLSRRPFKKFRNIFPCMLPISVPLIKPISSKANINNCLLKINLSNIQIFLLFITCERQQVSSF